MSVGGRAGLSGEGLLEVETRQDWPAGGGRMAGGSPEGGRAWVGMLAPAATAGLGGRAMNAGMNGLVALPETQARFAQMGGGPMPGTPDDFAAFVRAEIEKWRAVIQREGLQMDAS